MNADMAAEPLLQHLLRPLECLDKTLILLDSRLNANDRLLSPVFSELVANAARAMYSVCEIIELSVGEIMIGIDESCDRPLDAWVKREQAPEASERLTEEKVLDELSIEGTLDLARVVLERGPITMARVLKKNLMIYNNHLPDNGELNPPVVAREGGAQ